MKKTLVALAALAAIGTASAQSSVTLFGVLDASISGYSNKAEDKNFPTLTNPEYLNVGHVTTSRTGLGNSGYNASRLGFRGTEDLGGGMAASFWLEAGLGNDQGTAGKDGMLFNRRTTVSLSGPFGEVRLGRDYTPTYWNDTVFDPFGTNGVGTSLVYSANNGYKGNTNYDRASNSVGYFLPPNLGGFYGQLMYSFHEQAKYSPGDATPHELNNSRTGGYVGGRFGYATGPLDVAASYGSSTVGDDFYDGLTSKVNTWNLGASYDFGPVKLFGEYSQAKYKVSDSNPIVDITDPINGFRSFNEPSVKGWLVGATVPVGAGLIRVSYSSVKYDLDEPAALVNPGAAFDPIANPLVSNPDPKANKFAIGYVHNLSKRTALYASVARISNKDGAGLTVGGPNFVTQYKPTFSTAEAAALTPKTSTGYDIGIRHTF
ncbi:porin [Variovorax sp. YR216]|uniref:porin n=1 Tax=Variovorax sp. YR216 TaxID=1882828 RepID=UPI0008981EE3|nr:porin [Variovorax sp. YR216]SEA01451.1 Outer membrane protein (porin) [Variovorax sp. YR216]